MPPLRRMSWSFYGCGWDNHRDRQQRHIANYLGPMLGGNRLPSRVHMPRGGLTDKPPDIRLGIICSPTVLQALQAVLELHSGGRGGIVDIITHNVRCVRRRGSRVIDVAICGVQAGRGA